MKGYLIRQDPGRWYARLGKNLNPIFKVGPYGDAFAANYMLRKRAGFIGYEPNPEIKPKALGEAMIEISFRMTPNA